MTDSPHPPDYTKLPPSIARADVEDALIVAVARILGLCWNQKYRRSPPYTPDQQADLVGRPRTTLYRHLNKLQQLHWLRVGHRSSQITIMRVGHCHKDCILLSGLCSQAGEGVVCFP